VETEHRDPATSDDPILPAPGTKLSGRALGIDVGGTGVKAAVVDLDTGQLASERIREKTPKPATPEAVLGTIASVVGKLGDAVTSDMPAGCGLPGVVKYGALRTASNIDKSWLDAPVEEMMRTRLERPVLLLNDADAAGIAEMTYGAGVGRMGTVLLLTLGTGIGSGLFVDGHLVPNTELGHLVLDGKDAETRVSGNARERRGLGWKEWAREFNGYLALVDLYFSPDLIILGGGVSKEMQRFASVLKSNAEIVAAKLLNTAGIVGAAYAGAGAAHAGGGAPTVFTPEGTAVAAAAVEQSEQREPAASS
jgi:polyphosphate glucokinase